MKNVSKRKTKGPVRKPIKLRLNYRTVVTLKSEASLRTWMERYPEAVIIEE